MNIELFKKNMEVGIKYTNYDLESMSGYFSDSMIERAMTDKKFDIFTDKQIIETYEDYLDTMKDAGFDTEEDFEEFNQAIREGDRDGIKYILNEFYSSRDDIECYRIEFNKDRFFVTAEIKEA